MDDSVTATRSFELREVQSIFHGEPRLALFYEESTSGEVVELSDDGRQLSLSQNVHDGFSATYERVESAPK